MTESRQKICTKCREVKPISEFYRSALGRYGVRSHCKKCDNDGRRHYGQTKSPLGKLCECGCGQVVNGNNHFIHNHHKPQQGEPHTDETKHKISRANHGKVRTEEFKKKLSEALRGENHPLWGKHHSDVSKAKISLHRKGKTLPESWRRNISAGHSGKKNNNWRGGISKIPYTQDWTNLLKEAIRQRDNYTCQICCTHQDDLARTMDVHHIDYNKENCDPVNLITLCRSCHMKTNRKREKWISFFRGRNTFNGNIIYEGKI